MKRATLGHQLRILNAECGRFSDTATAEIEKLGDVDLYVFSDDPDWVRTNIQHPNIIFVSDFNFSAEQDLWLISACQHQIIANSSFSWWGAWLNNNDHKKVVYPCLLYTSDAADE